MDAPNGATSPTGASHPGTIRFTDHVDGREWIKEAAEVPQVIAWKDVDGVWHAVTRVDITGSAQRREIKSFGEQGEFLSTTVQSPPRR
jgi:hypothetical protein